MLFSKSILHISLFSLFVWLSACSFAPHYERPAMPIPNHYKEEGIWVSAKPKLETATKEAPWWTLFHDEILNQLERKLTCDNNNIKVALGRYQEARAIAQATQSAMYPTINGIGTAARQQNSATVANSNDLPILLYNTFILGAILNYELDAWGRVRNSVIQSGNLARASAFDLAAIDLSMHTELAMNYFELRGDDEAQRVLDITVAAYEKVLYLTKQRHSWGIDPQQDVDQAITELENAKTLAADMRLKRAQREHAIAVLIGEIPSNFSIKPVNIPFKFATVSPDISSTLLQRRPDIVAAEQRVFAANASIGVARAAFFPQIHLVGLIAVQSSQLSNLFSSPSVIWSLGPNTALTLIQPEVQQVIFDGFKLEALLSKAKAIYFETVNAYKQTVLTAFQEVEDGLVAIHRLDQEYQTQAKSTAAAKRALIQANRRYKGGIATFLNVIVTEDEALKSELALITIRTRRQLASVQLIKALGGGWHRRG